MYLIVPSIREESLQRFISEWDRREPQDKGTTLMIIEDNPEMTFELAASDWVEEHWSWLDIELDLGSRSWIIPRRSDTVRSYGYYKCWTYTTRKHDVTFMTLDDDCYPERHEIFQPDDESLYQRHIEQMTNKSRWFNTLNSGKPRGIPFKNVGEREVVLNHGLWMNVLDYDAPTQLVDAFREEFSYDNRIVPAGQYFPLCGMNVAWHKKITVLMYHLLMGCVNVTAMPKNHADNVRKNCIAAGSFTAGAVQLYKLPYDRFGDIWCGILMKKVCDHLGLAVTSGIPYIHHDRASDPFTNLIKEANGLKVNEIFWERVDKMTLLSTNPVDCYAELGQQMKLAFADQEHAWYFDMLGDAMVIWAGLFIGWDPASLPSAQT